MSNSKSSSINAKFANELVDDSAAVVPMAILSTFLVLLLTVAIFWWYRSRNQVGRRGECLLLCGLSNAGKTLLFLRLVKNLAKQTVTSAVTNRDFMDIEVSSTNKSAKKIEVIDIPGNSRIREREFSANKLSAKAILFVVDSTTIQDESKEVADYLYDILREKSFRYQRVPILIFCNKQDLNNGNESSDSIRRLLEAELTVKRRTRASSVAVHQGKTEQVEDIGHPNKENFEFADVKDLKIKFIDGSALGIERKSFMRLYQDGEDEEIESGADETDGDIMNDLEGVYEWIEEIWA